MEFLMICADSGDEEVFSLLKCEDSIYSGIKIPGSELLDRKGASRKLSMKLRVQGSEIPLDNCFVGRGSYWSPANADSHVDHCGLKRGPSIFPTIVDNDLVEFAMDFDQLGAIGKAIRHS